MAVTRSPFSSSGDERKPWEDDSISERWKSGEKDSGSVRRAPTLNDLKSSKQEEKMQLDKAVSTGLARVSTAPTSRSSKVAASKELKNILNKGQGGSKGIWGQLASIATSPVRGGLKLLEVSARTGQWLQAGSKELSDAFELATVGAVNAVNPFGDITTDKRPSWSEFVKQGKNKKFRLAPQTGVKWLDSTIDFGVDVVSDPITYFGVGGPARFLGMAGRVTLGTKFGTKDMLAKYPEMADKLDDVIRYGVAAIPKSIREAEGIQHGVRYAGRVIPKTEKLANAFVGKYGLITVPRVLLGDVINNSFYAQAARVALTPKSLKPFVVSGVGRGLGNVAQGDIVQMLADSTAKRYAKGAVAVAYQKNVAGIRDLLKQAKDAGELDNVIRIAEQPILYDAATPVQREMVDQFKAWQREIVEEVNGVYDKFGTDFGARVRGINIIDDFVHHRLTAQAKEFIYSGGGLKKGLFKEADLSADEIVGFTGAARHRKYRGQVKDADGNIIKRGEEFMGVELETGSIDEINKIFADKSGLGPDAKFFETDLVSIADSYAYSMAKARGREAYIRRLMDFGDDAVRKIGTKVKMDPDLIDNLEGVHKAIIKQRNNLVGKITRTRDKARDTAENALGRMERILAGREESVKMTRKEIDTIRKEIARLELKMVEALDIAATKQADERAAFMEMHKALMDEIAMLKTALELDEGEVYGVVKNLQKIYAATFPNAKRIPKDPTVLYERIMVAKGVAKPRELFSLEKRRKAIQAQYEELVEQGGDPNFINALLDEDKVLVQHIDAATKIGDVRVRADYAEDGLLYGSIDDLTELQFDPSVGEFPPYRTLNTKIIDPQADQFDPTTTAVYKETFKSSPDSVAVHAVPTENVVDMRDPDGYYWFFSPENDVHKSVGAAMDRAGLEGSVFVEEYEALLREGTVEPFFEDNYPELHGLMMTIYNADTLEFPEGVVPDEVTGAVFDEIREYFNMIAAERALPDSDVVGKQMFDDMLGFMAEMGQGSGDTAGWLFPSRVIYGADNPDALGSYSLVIPSQYSYSKGVPVEELMGSPTAKVTPLAEEGTFVRAVLDADYETASLTAHEDYAAVTGRLLDQEGLRLQTEEAAQQVKELGIEIGTAKGQATKRLNAAGKQMERYNRTGKIRVTMDGGKTYKEMTPEQVRTVIARKEKKLEAEYQRLQSRLDRIMEKETGAIQRKMTTLEERLPTLFDKVRVFQRWNNETGEVLRRDIDAVRTALGEEPPKGVAGVESRAWTAKVERALESAESITDPKVREAYNRITTQLHADEAQLALLEYYQLPQLDEQLAFARRGVIGKIVPDIERGWEAIEALGVQVPDELYDLWRPQLQKLVSAGEDGVLTRKLGDGFNWMMRFFKTYALATVGTGVRNAMSATFMNFVAGVSPENISDGAKAAIAYFKTKGVDWVNVLTDDVVEQKLYQKAWELTEVTGHGMVDEISSLTLRNGVGERIVNNKYTRFFQGMHQHIERAVRMPMALDSLRNGLSYDETIARISRYHFDYSDLSKFDEKIKRFIPFWIWTSRNIPLQMVEMWARPSTYATYEKYKDQNPVNPDLILPSWIQEMGPIGLGGNFVMTPDLPQVRLQQAVEQFIDPKKAIGQLAPQFKLPIELLLTDSQLALDIPFTDKYEEAKGLDKAVAWVAELLGAESVGRRNPKTGKLEVSPKFQYGVGSAIPPIAQLQRLTGGALGGKSSYADRQLSSIFTNVGVPVREVTPSMERSELIRRQFAVRDYLKELEKQGRLAPKR